jgi:hypothetical protein
MPVHSILRAVAALALLTLAAIPSQAQRVDPATEAVPFPAVVPARGFDIVLLTHASAAALGDERRMTRFFHECRRQLAIPAGDSLAFIRSRQWEPAAGTSADADNLTVIVGRSVRTKLDCLVGDDLRAAAFARGFRVTSDTLYPYEPAITSLNFLRGERIVSSGELERISSTRLTARGLITVAGGLVRITVPIDSLAPAADGRADSLRLEITTADSNVARRVAIPWSAVKPMWEQVLRARAERLSGAAAVEGPALLQRLASPGMTPQAALDARVKLGVLFAEAGDVAAARTLLARAVADEPCLTLSAASPASARAIVAEVHRPADRCRASVGLTAAQAAVVPGLAHLRTPKRRLIGAFVFGAVVQSLVRSQAAKDEAKDAYFRYLLVDGTDPAFTANLAAGLYDEAESRRLAGRRLVTFGAALWGASIVEATWSEYRLSQRLARVQDFDTRVRSVSLAPSGATGRVGIALNFF